MFLSFRFYRTFRMHMREGPIESCLDLGESPCSGPPRATAGNRNLTGQKEA